MNQMSRILATEVRPTAQAALARSPIGALRGLRVEQVDDALQLVGSVHSFYHKQLAQEAVRALGSNVRIINSIEVAIS